MARITFVDDSFYRVGAYVKILRCVRCNHNNNDGGRIFQPTRYLRQLYMAYDNKFDKLEGIGSGQESYDLFVQFKQDIEEGFLDLNDVQYRTYSNVENKIIENLLWQMRSYLGDLQKYLKNKEYLQDYSFERFFQQKEWFENEKEKFKKINPDFNKSQESRYEAILKDKREFDKLWENADKN